MGRRSPCCAKDGLNKGPWTASEDEILVDYIRTHGEGRWEKVPKRTGLRRCGKSCRLRWLNYLRPDIKRGNISGEEEDLIIRLHKLLGNRWALIAGRLPGRTDNEIKNYWNTILRKKLQQPSTNNKNYSNKCKDKKKKEESVQAFVENEDVSGVGEVRAATDQTHLAAAAQELLLDMNDGHANSQEDSSVALQDGDGWLDILRLCGGELQQENDNNSYSISSVLKLLFDDWTDERSLAMSCPSHVGLDHHHLGYHA